VKTITSDRLAERIRNEFGLGYSPTTDKLYSILPVKFYLKCKPFFSSFGKYEADLNDCDNSAEKIKVWASNQAYKDMLPAQPAAFFISYVTQSGFNHRAIIALTDEGWRLIDADWSNDRIAVKGTADIKEIRLQIKQGIWD
jgi:hypothetical protein